MSTLALEHVYTTVVAFLAADAAAQTPPATAYHHTFGWRESAQKMVTGPRYAWIPGDPNGRLGQLLPARAPGRNPRPIATLEELCTVEITSADADPAKAMDERAQYRAVRQAFDAWFRAMYLSFHGAFRLVDSSWVTARKELRHGATLRVVIAVQATLADEPVEVAPTDTNALVAMSLVDTVETTTVETTTTVPGVTAPGGDLVLDDDGNIVTEEAP